MTTQRAAGGLPPKQNADIPPASVAVQRPTQCERILAYLLTGADLTPLTALQLCGTLRLAARIEELEAQGVPISHTMVKVGAKRVCSYRLAIATG